MNQMKTLIDFLHEKATTEGDWTLYRFVDFDDDREQWTLEDHTISEVYHKSLEVAYMLRKKGLRPGDRAVIFSMQDFGTVYAVYGCMMAGVVFTIIPPPLDEDKIERFISVLKSCHPRALISNYTLEQGSGVSITGRLLKEAFRDTIRLKRIYTDRLLPYRRRDVIVSAREDQLVYLQYTSGSTSAPKGVRVTWKNLMKNLEQCFNCYTFDHVSLATWVPFFHNLGLVVTICMPLLATKSQGYFLQTLRFLENPKLWIRLISDFRITLTVGPGSAYDACTRIFSEDEAAQYSLSQVTHFMNGSEFISAKTVDRFIKMFHCAPNAMAPGYGVSENVCLATFASQDYRTLKLDYEAYQKNRAVIVEDSENAKEIVSVGAPVKDLTVVIGNPKTKKVYPDLRIGEIFLSGDSVADGYWGNPHDNQNFYVKMEGYDCNFYKTGDLGFLYRGHLYITGRVKEMLIVNGHNIYPSDLQVTINRCVPALAGSAYGFFACTSDTKEQIIAVIESRPDEDFVRRTRQINKAVSERFAFSFYDVIFVPRDTIPRTDNRKLQMLKARSLYQKGKLQILYSSHEDQLAHPGKNLLSEEPGESSSGSSERAEDLIDKADEIFIQVRAAFQRVLKIDHFNLTDSFLALGGDSLMGFELISNIEKKFHIRLDLRELLRDASVVGITEYIHSVLSGSRSAGKAVNLSNECRLDETIQPGGGYRKSPAECRKIFLTGATGFLGAQLIRCIMKYYPHDGLEIHCLVRADSPESAMGRLKDNLKHYHCWQEDMSRYLIPVTGDLSLPLLGLSGEKWQELSDCIEVVYHNGAVLNFVYPYSFLKTTNVNGTVETLRLACGGQPKYYHYVSSYSVYDTPGNRGKHVMEDDSLNSWHGFTLSYSETKWVSEKLVNIARQRGLKAVVYRPGDITGAPNGIWEMDDMVSRLLVSTIQMGAVPRANYSFHMTPVDYVAEALVYISRKEDACGHAFNLINPKPQSLKEVISAIRACGYPVHHIPFPLWRRRIREADASRNAMALLECLFEKGNERNPGVLRHFMGQDPVYDMSNTRLLLGQSGISCPPVNRKMIAAYLKYFKKKSYI